MSLWRFFLLATALSLLPNAARADFSRKLSFEIEIASNLNVVGCNTCLHFTCTGLEDPTAETLVSLPPIPAKGATTSFYVHVNSMSGSNDVQFTVLQDAVLRWTADGLAATWAIFDGEAFTTLGESVILAESGRHSVTVTRSVDSLTVVEDGKTVGGKESTIVPPKRTEVQPTYHLMVDGLGAELEIHVADIQVHPGFEAHPPATQVV